MVIFYNLRARMSLKHLSTQLFDKAAFLPAVSQDIIKSNDQYRPLVLDLRNATPDAVRVRDGISGVHAGVTVYQVHA